MASIIKFLHCIFVLVNTPTIVLLETETKYSVPQIADLKYTYANAVFKSLKPAGHNGGQYSIPNGANEKIRVEYEDVQSPIKTPPINIPEPNPQIQVKEQHQSELEQQIISKSESLVSEREKSESESDKQNDRQSGECNPAPNPPIKEQPSPKEKDLGKTYEEQFVNVKPFKQGPKSGVKSSLNSLLQDKSIGTIGQQKDKELYNLYNGSNIDGFYQYFSSLNKSNQNRRQDSLFSFENNEQRKGDFLDNWKHPTTDSMFENPFYEPNALKELVDEEEEMPEWNVSGEECDPNECTYEKGYFVMND